MMNVNGLPLPEELLNLISNGRWKEPKEKELIRHLGIEDAEDLDFLNLTEMERNTSQLQKLVSDGEFGEVLGIASSKDASNIPKGFFDVSKAVVIAATHGDEFLCLDYSSSTKPKVVATHSKGSQAEWLVVANNFESFVEQLKL